MLILARNTFYSAIAACLLSACGGGGDGDAAAAAGTTTSQQALSISSSSTSSEASSSSGQALADTVALSPDDLSVYVTQNVSLPISELVFEGNLRVVKIRSALNKTLFLGQWPKNSDFDMPIYAELAAFPLMVEVFTESQSDETVTWEVRYEG